MTDEMHDMGQRLRGFVATRVSEDIIRVCKHNEGQTIDSLVKPFLHEVLGWDMADPFQARRHYTLSPETRPREKLDFALMVAGRPEILIEVKSAEKPMGHGHACDELNQLKRYMESSEADLALLTNGLIWQWHVSEVGRKKNALDNSPVHRLDLCAVDDASVKWLHYVSRKHFEPSHVHVEAAIERLRQEMREPSDSFVQKIVKASGLQVKSCDRAHLVTALRSMIQEEMAAGAESADRTARAADSTALSAQSPGSSLSARPSPPASTGTSPPPMRWKTGDGDWSVHKKAIGLYVDVLRWLARQHDDGMHDWAGRVITRYSGSFSWEQEGRFRARIDLDSQDMYCRDLGNKDKLRLLDAITGMTIRNGQPLVMDQDLHVVMDSQPRSTPES